MPVSSRLRSAFRRRATDESITPVAVAETQPSKTDASPESGVQLQATDVKPEDERPTENTQRGVQGVEAVTLTWSKRTLIAVFIKYVVLVAVLFTMLIQWNSIWLLYFVNAMQSNIINNLTPYITSQYESHSLLNTIYIVADSISAAIFIPLAKVMDVWGRAEGFLMMTVLATAGLIMMAGCHNLPTFCAAYV